MANRENGLHPGAGTLTSPPAPSSCPVQLRQSGSCINSTQRSDTANNISNPFLILSCFYSLFLSLMGDGVQLTTRARTCTSGPALSFSNHFINTPSDWLKPGVNFYSSPLASEWAKVAKLPLSSWPTDPHFPVSRQQTATPHVWCERLHGVKAVGNAGCWFLAWSKIQGTIKPTESH